MQGFAFAENSSVRQTEIASQLLIGLLNLVVLVLCVSPNTIGIIISPISIYQSKTMSENDQGGQLRCARCIQSKTTSFDGKSLAEFNHDLFLTAYPMPSNGTVI